MNGFPVEESQSAPVSPVPVTESEKKYFHYVKRFFKFYLLISIVTIILIIPVIYFQQSKNPSATPASSEKPKIKLEGNLIFLNSKNVLKILDLKDSTYKNFIPEKELAKNNIKIVHSAIPSTDGKHLLLQTYSSNDYRFRTNDLMYFTVSANGENLSKINTAKINKSLDSTGYIDIKNWTYKKNSLVFTITQRASKNSFKILIGEYDLNSNTTAKLYETDKSATVQLYDPQNSSLYLLREGTKLSLVNTKTSEEKTFNIALNTNNAGGTGTNLFSIKGLNFDIYSVLSPKNPPKTISSPNYINNNWMLWSPNNNYFVYVARNTKNDPVTYIFNKEGRSIANLADVDVWQKSIFSSDEKQLLAIYYNNSTSQSFKVLDIERLEKDSDAKEYIQDVNTLPSLSDPVLWIK